MSLPEAVDQLISSDPSTEPSPEVQVVRQAMWIADRTLGSDSQRITLDAEAELLGLSQDLVDQVNDNLQDLLGLVHDYRSA